MCHQSGGLIARALERAGIPTVSIGMMRGLLMRIGIPRGVVTRNPRGRTMGNPGDAAAQRRVLEGALELLASAKPGEIRQIG